MARPAAAATSDYVLVKAHIWSAPSGRRQASVYMKARASNWDELALEWRQVYQAPDAALPRSRAEAAREAAAALLWYADNAAD